MHSSTLILLFLLGLGVGSFLNVLIARLPRNKSLFGRSHCPLCKKTISWYDNIPLVSFAILKGQCRACRSPISWQYPLVELITAVLFVFSYISLGIRGVWGIREIGELVYYLFIISSLIAIFFIDLKHRIIPDTIIYPTIVISFLFVLISQHPNISISHFISAIIAFLFFFFLHLVTHGQGMGFGDVKLSFLLGLFLGFPRIVVALYASFLTGATVSLILVVKGKKRLKDTIAFGPFLVLGAIVAFLFSQSILRVVCGALPICEIRVVLPL